jgi:CubicO group peptidase (beta-lactamase class C family)
MSPSKSSRLVAAATLATLLLSVPCAAQSDPTARVDAFVASEMKKQHIPGVSVAVVRDGTVVLAKGYGFANVEHQVPVKPETIFQSGSVGKQFTATAVMMLVEEGKIGLDDPITKYFPDGPEAWKAIKVRNLLSHTGGTTDYPNDFDFRKDYTEDDLLKRAETIPLAFKPGEKWSYSNLGYVLLGILIHKVSGKFYGDFLQERIFKPLDMSTARIISEEDIVPNRAAGYRLEKGALKNQEWVSPSVNTTADGALYLTALDMARWDAALYTEKLLKKSSLDQMWTPVTLNDGKPSRYGFGWGIGEIRGHRIVEHGGAWQGFKAYIARYVDKKLTVIAFANLAQADPSKIAHGVAGLYDAELEPIRAQAIEDKEPKVTALTKLVLEKTVDGGLDPELFTPEARAMLFPDRVAQAGALLKGLGPLGSIELVGRDEAGESRTYRYRATFGDTPLLVVVAMTKDGKIGGIRMAPE